MSETKINDKRYESTFGIDKRPNSEVSLEVKNKKHTTSLLLRREGASVRELNIDGKVILTSPELGDEFEQSVKIDASHTMLPAGPSEVGPQHGASRYLTYAADTLLSSTVRLSARDGFRELGHLKTFHVQPNGLQIIDEVVRLDGDTTGISLGEHFYFKVEEQTIPEIELLNEDGEATDFTVRKMDGSMQTGTIKDLWPELGKGASFFCEDHFGSIILRLPTGEKLLIEASIEGQIGEASVQFLIWHRPETDTVCFEPIAGFTRSDDGALKNDGIALGSQKSLRLTSQITMI